MNQSDRDRLLKLCRLLASDQDGERATAASMANKLADRLGGWDKVLAQPGDQSQNPHGSFHEQYQRAQRADDAMRRAMDAAWARAAYYNAGFNASQQRKENFDWYGSEAKQKPPSATDMEKELERMKKEREERLKNNKF